MIEVAKPVFRTLFGIYLLLVHQQAVAITEYYSGSGKVFSISSPSIATKRNCEEFSEVAREVRKAIQDEHNICIKGKWTVAGEHCSHAECEDLHVAGSEISRMVTECFTAARIADRQFHVTANIGAYATLNSVFSGSNSYSRYKSAAKTIENAVKATKVKDNCDTRVNNIDPKKCVSSLGSYVKSLNNLSQSSRIVKAIQDNSLDAIISHQIEMLRIFDQLQKTLEDEF